MPPVTPDPKTLIRDKALELGFDVVPVALVRKQLLQALTKRGLRLVPTRQPCVEYRLRQVLKPFLIQQVGNPLEIEHEIADCDAGVAAAVSD